MREEGGVLEVALYDVMRAEACYRGSRLRYQLQGVNWEEKPHRTTLGATISWPLRPERVLPTLEPQSPNIFHDSRYQAKTRPDLPPL